MEAQEFVEQGGTPSMRKPLSTWTILLAGALVMLLAVGGIYMISRPGRGNAAAHAAEWTLPNHVEHPVWMPTATPSLQKAYAFAASHYEELRFIPCYCGCDGQHKDNFECYYKHDGTGTITGFEEHAYGCQVCQEITHEVIKGLEKGKSLEKIRAEIDKLYKNQELTPTPTPPVPKR
jgi:hypothetical protein